MRQQHHRQTYHRYRITSYNVCYTKLLRKGRQVERLLFTDPETKEKVADSKKMGFYKKQIRRNNFV